MGLLIDTTLLVQRGIGEMVTKGHSILSRALELKSPQLMQFSIMAVFGGVRTPRKGIKSVYLL